MKFGIFQSPTPASITTGDFTDDSSAGFSSDVVAAIAWSGTSIANDTKTAASEFELGFAGVTGGTTEGSSSIRGLDGVTPAEGSRNNVEIYNKIGPAEHGVVSSWLTDGIRINFTAKDANQYLLGGLLLGGAGVEAKVLHFTWSAETGAKTIAHGLSGTPKFLKAVHSSSASDTFNGTNEQTIGLWAGGVTRGMGSTSADGNPSVIQRLLSTTVWPNILGTNENITVTTVDATNITLTTAGQATLAAHVLAVYAPDLEAAVGTFQTPTVTGNAASISGLSFAPRAVLMLGTENISVDGTNTGDSASTLMVGAHVNNGGTTYYGAIADSTDDNVATADRNNRITASKAIMITEFDGDVDIEATVTSWDSGGVTYNYSNVNAIARYGIYLALGSSAVPGFSGLQNLDIGIGNARFGGRLEE